MHVGEVGAYPHAEACPHTLLFAHRVTSGLWNHAKRHRSSNPKINHLHILFDRSESVKSYDIKCYFRKH